MRTEVVVRRAEHDCAVYFEQGLAVLVGLFHVTVLHLPYALLGAPKGCREDGIEHETGAAT
jgi:hypothetical protein